MTELILFHHAQGLTDGVHALADELRDAGHVVHLPDLYEGRTYATLSDGMAGVEQIGFDAIVERGRAGAEGLPDDLVYAGISLGVLPAQALAQTRPGARGALLIEACVPPSEFGESWPAGVPVQIHLAQDDEVTTEDRDAARDFDAVPEAELFLYASDRHLFTDPSLPTYDEGAATLLVQRVLGFL